MSKKQLGKFYTTNYEYILQNMKIPADISHIIEPFAGNCDLLNFIDTDKYIVEAYDIDSDYKNIIKRDTLKNPPCYDDKFVLTNPPYLARNKNKNKELYDKYNCNDLYKCFIINLINSKKCQGGIIIIPLNFISSNRKSDINLRKRFFKEYIVDIINLFEEKVFDDTSYTVCSMLFNRRGSQIKKTKLYIYPTQKCVDVSFSEENNYTIGGEIYNLPVSEKYKIERATKFTTDDEYITNILLKCIDDSTLNQLGFRIINSKDRYIDNTEKLSARSYATLVVKPMLSLQEQEKLVQEANSYLKKKREKYNSLFLSNYRESNGIARKRISFRLAFQICSYILSR